MKLTGIQVTKVNAILENNKSSDFVKNLPSHRRSVSENGNNVPFMVKVVKRSDDPIAVNISNILNG